MSYREYGMWEVLEVLKRHHRRESQRHIARATGRARKTIRRYLRTASKLGWDGSSPPNESLASRVCASLRPGPPPGESLGVEHRLRPYQARIRRWLEGEPGERGLQLTKVHQLLSREAVEVSYSALYRYAVEHLQFRGPKQTIRRAEVAPGELAEVDFGRLGKLYDPETQRTRILWALIVTLGYSRHQYVHVTWSQKLAELIDGLEDAWEWFGGVPARVVIDNLRAAVVRSHRYEPIFQRTFDEYAEHRNFIIDPTRTYDGQGKPIVERGVPYVRENFFRGEKWLDAAHVQRAARRWCLEVAGRRIHGTTRRAPLVVFEQEERALLRPVPGPRFDTPHWAEPKVHPDHHIQFLNALYSVPTRYLGKQVTVRGDKALVRIYYQGQLIKTHPKKQPGGRSTDYRDYPDELEAYARRDPNRMIRQASAVGPQTCRFMKQLLSGTFPWSKLRQAQKLMRLAAKYGSTHLESACQRALAFDLINVSRVERIIKNAIAPQPDFNPHPKQLPLRPLKFLRPNHSFSHKDDRKETRDADQNLPENGSQAAQALGHPAHPSRPDCLRSENESS